MNERGSSRFVSGKLDIAIIFILCFIYQIKYSFTDANFLDLTSVYLMLSLIPVLFSFKMLYKLNKRLTIVNTINAVFFVIYCLMGVSFFWGIVSG